MSGFSVSRDVFVELKNKTKAALNNEAITRQRVEAVEAALIRAEAFVRRPFLGRLKWLLLGR
jgi:hypothetical protein